MHTGDNFRIRTTSWYFWHTAEFAFVCIHTIYYALAKSVHTASVVCGVEYRQRLSVPEVRSACRHDTLPFTRTHTHRTVLLFQRHQQNPLLQLYLQENAPSVLPQNMTHVLRTGLVPLRSPSHYKIVHLWVRETRQRKVKGSWSKSPLQLLSLAFAYLDLQLGIHRECYWRNIEKPSPPHPHISLIHTLQVHLFQILKDWLP